MVIFTHCSAWLLPQWMHFMQDPAVFMQDPAVSGRRAEWCQGSLVVPAGSVLWGEAPHGSRLDPRC